MHTFKTLVVKVTADNNVTVRANQTAANIENVEAVTASVAAGGLALSGGGIDIDSIVANEIYAYIEGPAGTLDTHTVNATGNIIVEAKETVALDADSTNVSVAIGAGLDLALGVSLLDIKSESIVSAKVQNSYLNAKNISVLASTDTNISKTDCGRVGFYWRCSIR